MERIKPEKADKAIKQFVKAMGIEDAFKAYRIKKTFGELIGENLSRHVTKKTIVGRKMFIYVDSSIARNSIFMQKTDIIQKINNLYGEFILEEIIIK